MNEVAETVPVLLSALFRHIVKCEQRRQEEKDAQLQ